MSRQVKFAVVNSLWEISQSPLVECITTRQSPQCVPLVCDKFTENPEFRMGNFAGNLKREISHAKLKCHENPPPPPVDHNFPKKLGQAQKKPQKLTKILTQYAKNSSAKMGSQKSSQKMKNFAPFGGLQQNFA